ncbi:MAG TPA: hypothetical protein VHY21_04120 [Pseudonocardiaceae bacterium]|nr:hypothetical protein [Pseudonocardiaceae bacterium]
MSGKTLEITSVDDDKISIRHRPWTDALRREHLERAAELIEEGRTTRHAGLFAEDYRVPLSPLAGEPFPKHSRSIAGHVSTTPNQYPLPDGGNTAASVPEASGPVAGTCTCPTVRRHGIR